MKMLRLTEEELAQRIAKHKGRIHTIEDQTPTKQARHSKYHNKRFQDEKGEWWDSRKEFNRWTELRLLETAGKITDLKRQVPFELVPAKMKDGKRMRPIIYVADYVYIEEGVKVIEDAKGYRNELYKLKKRLMWQLLGIEIFET